MAVIEIRGLQGAYDALDSEIAKKASRRTINDLVGQSRTAASTKIRERYTIKAAALKKKMKTFTLNASGGQAKIQVKGSIFRLTDFANTRQTTTGISVKIKKSGSRKIIQHGFMTTLGTSHVGAFRRRYRKLYPQAPRGTRITGFARMPKKYRLPIEEIPTIGPADMFNQKDIYDEIQKLIDDRYETIFQRNYAFYAG